MVLFVDLCGVCVRVCFVLGLFCGCVLCCCGCGWGFFSFAVGLCCAGCGVAGFLRCLVVGRVDGVCFGLLGCVLGFWAGYGLLFGWLVGEGLVCLGCVFGCLFWFFSFWFLLVVCVGFFLSGGGVFCVVLCFSCLWSGVCAIMFFGFVVMVLCCGSLGFVLVVVCSFGCFCLLFFIGFVFGCVFTLVVFVCLVGVVVGILVSVLLFGCWFILC